MARIRTEIQLSTALDDQFGWRVQEISEIKKAIISHQTIAKRALIRASVPIAYAHWEGFVKAAAAVYGSFISNRGLRFVDVEPSLMGIAAIEAIKTLEGVRKRIFVASEAISKLIDLEREPCVVKIEGHISHVGNLSFDVFDQISRVLGLNTSWYLGRKNLIDEQLLKSRNTVAHGDYLEIDEVGAISLGAEVITLMRQFKTDIENAAALKGYLRNAA